MDKSVYWCLNTIFYEFEDVSNVGALDDHLFTSGAVADPADANLALILNKADVILRVLGQLFEAVHSGDVFSPAWQIDIHWGAAG